jgi:hypothetical protein
LSRSNHTRELRLSAQMVVAAFVAVPIALSLGARNGAADSLEFRGQLNYKTFAAAARRGDSVRIKRSPGGTGAAAMMLSRVNGLIIDGRCDSACVWAFVRNPTGCFTRRASFGFHGAHDPGTGRRMLVATKYWLSLLPASLQKRLKPLLSSSRVIRLNSKQMAQYYPDRVCTSRGARVIVAHNVVPPLPIPAQRHRLPSAETVSTPSTIAAGYH